jgi:hypothetical protein
MIGYSKLTDKNEGGDATSDETGRRIRRSTARSIAKLI